MWLSLIQFISVLFVFWNLFCAIVNIRIKCVTENQNCFCFEKILNQAFLHYSHIWLSGLFTFLVALAHGAPPRVSTSFMRHRLVFFNRFAQYSRFHEISFIDWNIILISLPSSWYENTAQRCVWLVSFPVDLQSCAK